VAEAVAEVEAQAEVKSACDGSMSVCCGGDDNSDGAENHPLAWRNHYFDPDVNKMMSAAAQELNADKRKAAYAALMKKVTEEGPFIITFQNSFQHAFRTNVKGYYASVDYDNYRKVTKS
jgi:peptide/nickel transport system substrate-binding protein